MSWYDQIGVTLKHVCSGVIQQLHTMQGGRSAQIWEPPDPQALKLITPAAALGKMDHLRGCNTLNHATSGPETG